MATSSAKFDLSVSLGEERAPDGAPAGIGGVLEYATDLFDRASVEALAARLVRLLEAAVADPERRSAASTSWRPTSAPPSCTAWNDTARAIPSATLPELFAAQVARTPDAIAVVFEDESLTYARARCARQPAGASPARAGRRARGAWSGCASSARPTMVVGLLGILKAGGAYRAARSRLSGRAPALHAG